jgi:hypothetical protein
MRTSFHHQPEAQHPKIFSYPQAGPADYPIFCAHNGLTADIARCPKCAKGLNRSRGRALRRAAWACQ